MKNQINLIEVRYKLEFFEQSTYIKEHIFNVIFIFEKKVVTQEKDKKNVNFIPYCSRFRNEFLMRDIQIIMHFNYIEIAKTDRCYYVHV